MRKKDSFHDAVGYDEDGKLLDAMIEAEANGEGDQIANRSHLARDRNYATKAANPFLSRDRKSVDVSGNKTPPVSAAKVHRKAGTISEETMRQVMAPRGRTQPKRPHANAEPEHDLRTKAGRAAAAKARGRRILRTIFD